MSLFVCSKCGCIDNTATSYYWALIRPCKNRIYDKSLKGYEGKPLCFSFSRVLVEELIKTFETIRDRYSDNYELKVYLYNCIIQLSVNPKDPSESFFGVYDRDEMKLIYGIKISILKGMFGI